ncbi:hypothetical protein [Microbacterium pygmaeum]|uniref:hypothetical protein n=1 Tax=Microbacterium pygmaeum TaxID=370764 RepID=UPI0012FC7AC9|nr:hypothetical protein [Microbacterium pygmaeum]
MPKRDREAASASNLASQAERLIEFALQNPDQFRLISEVVAERAQTKLDQRRTHEYTASLVEQFHALSARESFRPGDLVVWKPRLKNRVHPAYDEPAVVVEVLETPVVNAEVDPSSTYFREPLDIVLGFLDDEDEILVYHYDSRRFAKAPNQTPNRVDV